MNTELTQEIQQQRDRILRENPTINLISPCKIGQGITKLTAKEIHLLTEVFEEKVKDIGVFIPASGSGSRMFEFLYDFLTNQSEDNRGNVERFLNKIKSFAFYRFLPAETRKALETFDISLEQFVSFLLNAEGMGFGDLPKALIPFHLNDPFVVNAIQEHIIQSARLNKENIEFHFSIQKRFESNFEASIRQLEGLTGHNFEVSYSEQNADTDSYVFYNNGDLVLDENGQPLRRPAGHGALLTNLQALNKELIFIRNIDNVQHYSKSSKSIQMWSVLGALLHEIRLEIKKLYKNPTVEGLQDLNEKFHLYSPSELDSIHDSSAILKLIDRPIRVCGMVRNEGQPGGGPFLVEENGVVTKQIVEKAQISQNGEQYRQMIQSTHFNPVMMAVCIFNPEGKKYDLFQFRDASKYFVVSKKQKGEEVRFVELPGLWNGSMANWNTLFVEIPNETFSPVKTVLDLLNEAHLAGNIE